MPSVEYEANGFPMVAGPQLVGSHTLSFTWPQLVWAAISVGRAELFHVVRHGQYSYFEMSYRASLLYANLMQLQDGILSRSSAYDGLDPSEKSAISYFLGMTLAKAFSDLMLDVPWLMHLDVYREDLDLVFGTTSRPDLVGQRRGGDWIVIECKGRTNGLDSDALDRAKQQARSVISVNGSPILYNVGVLSHFGGGKLQLSVSDPKGDRESGVDLPLNKEKLLSSYYHPIQTWIREAPESSEITVEGTDFRTVDVSDLDLRVGLASSIFEPGGLDDWNGQGYEANEQGSHFIGSDGLLVELGDAWMNENMMLEPQSRP